MSIDNLSLRVVNTVTLLKGHASLGKYLYTKTRPMRQVLCFIVFFELTCLLIHGLGHVQQHRVLRVHATPN